MIARAGRLAWFLATGAACLAVSILIDLTGHGAWSPAVWAVSMAAGGLTR